MKKSNLLFISLVGMLLVFAGSVWAETDNQYRNRNQNRNTVQTRRAKQNLSCQTVIQGEVKNVTGRVSECNYDGFTIIANDVPYVINGLGPISYWEAKEVERPYPDAEVTVEYVEVKFSELVTKNIMFSFSYGSSVIPYIQLRDKDTGCPLWRSW